MLMPVKCGFGLSSNRAAAIIPLHWPDSRRGASSAAIALPPAVCPKNSREPGGYFEPIFLTAGTGGSFSGERMPLRMRVQDREPIGAALRRFKKLLERSGLQKELRKRKHYEKPCEVRRRAKLRKQSAIRKAAAKPAIGM